MSGKDKLWTGMWAVAVGIVTALASSVAFGWRVHAYVAEINQRVGEHVVWDAAVTEDFRARVLRDEQQLAACCPPTKNGG